MYHCKLPWIPDIRFLRWNRIKTHWGSDNDSIWFPKALLGCKLAVLPGAGEWRLGRGEGQLPSQRGWRLRLRRPVHARTRGIRHQAEKTREKTPEQKFWGISTEDLIAEMNDAINWAEHRRTNSEMVDAGGICRCPSGPPGQEWRSGRQSEGKRGIWFGY